MSIAFAHSGESHPPPLGEVSLWGPWSFDPAFLLVLLLAGLYFRGLWEYRAQGGRALPAWRPWFFLAGLVTLAVALLSPIDFLSDFSFAWHMLQHQLLVLVAVPFLLLGAPLVPVVRGIPRPLRLAAFVPMAKNRAVRVAFIQGTRPVVGFAVLQGALILWHVPWFYDQALAHEWVHYLEHFSFLLGGALFWWNPVAPYPFPPRGHYLVRVLALFASMMVGTALGAVFVFSEKAIYGYQSLENGLGIPAMVDQQLGGGLMWVSGGIAYVAAAWVILFANIYDE